MFRFCVENSIEEKVIEKAYKKLRLDALVIQQGRLTENTKSVNKDDLLAMVRYGAEMVFSSEASAPPVQLQTHLPQCARAHSLTPQLMTASGGVGGPDSSYDGRRARRIPAAAGETAMPFKRVGSVVPAVMKGLQFC